MHDAHTGHSRSCNTTRHDSIFHLSLQKAHAQLDDGCLRRYSRPAEFSYPPNCPNRRLEKHRCQSIIQLRRFQIPAFTTHWITVHHATSHENVCRYRYVASNAMRYVISRIYRLLDNPAAKRGNSKRNCLGMSDFFTVPRPRSPLLVVPKLSNSSVLHHGFRLLCDVSS